MSIDSIILQYILSNWQKFEVTSCKKLCFLLLTQLRRLYFFKDNLYCLSSFPPYHHFKLLNFVIGFSHVSQTLSYYLTAPIILVQIVIGTLGS